MRRESDWRTRNNPFHLDLFERSSQSLSSSASSSTLDMALNDRGNVRRRLSDYARPVLQRLVSRIHAPLARNTNFRIDSHVMSMLPIFHGKPSEDAYRHVDELSQVCEINQIHNVSADVIKMKLFPATLRDSAKDWFLKLGKEFTSWTEMEEEFLRKYYSIGRTTSVRKVMREFTQGPSEIFHEAWDRLRDLTRECPHHGVSNHELTQIFYDGLGPQDRYLLDIASDTFMSKFEDEAIELIETVAENSHHNVTKPFGRGATLKGGLIDAKSVETGMLLEKIDKMAEVQNLLLDQFHIRNGFEGLAPVALQEASPCAHCSRLDYVEMDCPIMEIQGQGMYGQGPPRGPSQHGRSNYQGTYPNYFNNPVYNNPMQQQGFRRNTDQTCPLSYNTSQQQNSQQQPYAKARQSTYIPLQQSYNQAPRSTAPSADPILGAISQLMEQMNMMNSRVDEIQDFVKMNIPTSTDNKKGKQFRFLTNYHCRPLSTRGIKVPHQVKCII